MIEIKSRWRRVLAAVCATVVVFCTLPLNAYAADSEGTGYSIDNVKEKLDRAANFQLIEQKMWRCLAGTGNIYQMDAIGTLIGGNKIDQVYKGHLFMTGTVSGVVNLSNVLGSLTNTDVGVGYYLEDALTNPSKNSADGAMDCGAGGGGDYADNAILMTYINYLRQAGLLGEPSSTGSGSNPSSAQIKMVLDSFGYVGNCKDWSLLVVATDFPCYVLYGNGTWETWNSTTHPDTAARTGVGGGFKYWHDRYKNEYNEFLVDYTGLQYFSGGGEESRTPDNVAYFLLAKEMSVFCSGNVGNVALQNSTVFDASEVSTDDSNNSYQNKLKWVNTQNGSIEETYVKKGGIGSSGDKEQANSFGANKRTCEQLIVDVSELASAVQEEYRNAKIGMCREESLVFIADKRTELEAVEGSLSQEQRKVKEVLDQLDADISERGDEAYIKGDANVGWTCTIDAIKEAEYKSAGEENNSTGVTDPCTSNAGTFSWIICPAISMLQKAVEGLFGLIEGMLVINPGILATDTETGGATYTGWQTFRDLANVVLVILFVAIIVSQVTGFGIDNYGIKKMLPRLIVIGVLINLSYIVCQLAVDISNIVGANMYEFLKSMAENISVVATDGQGGLLLAAIAFAIGGLITAIAITAGTMLLPLLLGLVSGLISALFMFVLLGVRQAAVAIFVVIAPLAFAMNILPNTQGLFKKWWNVFKTLLLLYPICAMVMGGGLYGCMLVMSLSGTEGGVLGAVFMFVGFALLIAPVFFIPKLTQGAFAGLGKIGGAITGMGGKLSGMAKTGISKSETVKRWGDDLTAARNKRVSDKLSARRSSGKTLRSGQQRRLAAANRAVVKTREEERAEEIAADANYLASAENRASLRHEDEIAKMEVAATDPNFMAAERNRQTVQRDKEKGNLEYMASDRYLKASQAATTHAETVQAIKDQETMISNESIDKLRDGLVEAIEKNDGNSIAAYQNVLSRKGEDGRSTVREAMERAESRAAATGGTVSAEARMAFGRNIIDNHSADYKANARSTFNYANAMVNSNGTSSMSMAGSAVSSGQVRPETLASMDGDATGGEFERFVNNPANAPELKRMATEALLNPSLNNMSESRRRDLEYLAGGGTRVLTADLRAQQAQAGNAGVTAALTAQAASQAAANAQLAGINAQLRAQTSTQRQTPPLPPAPAPAGPTPTPTPTPAPVGPAPAPIPNRADRFNNASGNVRGNTTGSRGGRIVVDGPDAGREQTDSGIIL